MYAVMRIAKLKTMGEIGALGKHNDHSPTPMRERDDRADQRR